MFLHDSLDSKEPEVLCFGEALIDRLGPLGGDPELDEPVEDCFGGAPANVACGLARLGINVAFLGRLGDDFIGNSFRRLFLSKGVNVSGLQKDALRPSRIVLVRRDLNGERSFQGFAGDCGDGFSDQAMSVNELMDSWPLLASKASWLVVGSIPLATPTSAEALLWSLNEAVNAGLKIAFDVNWRPTFWNVEASTDSPPDQDVREVISKIFNQSSLIKLAKEEALWFFNSDDPCRISQSLPHKPDLVVTDGANPVRWLIDGFSGEMPAFSPSSLIDTTGAGDAFTAGLLSQILIASSAPRTSQRVREMISFAAACGALVCGGAGAIAPQASYEEVEKIPYISLIHV